MTFCQTECKIPKEHKKQTPPSVWLPSVLSVKRKESVWKGRSWATDGGAIPWGPLLLLFQRMQQVTLPETNTAPPSFLLYHFQSKVFAVWSMYFVSKAGYLGRRNKSLKRKTKSSSHLHTTVFLYIFIYAIIWRKQMTIFFGGEPPSLRGGGGHCTASEGHSHWFRVTLAKRKKTTAAVQRLSLSTC